MRNMPSALSDVSAEFDGFRDHLFIKIIIIDVVFGFCLIVLIFIIRRTPAFM